MSIYTIFLSLYILCGLVITGFGSRCVLQARASAAWPSAPGKIVETTIKCVLNEGTAYSPAVKYEYVVDGKSYLAERICFGIEAFYTSKSFAEKYTKRYPAGLPVIVYHDPFHPENAVLERGITIKSFIPMGFGLGFAACGGCFGLLWRLAHPNSHS